jgi:glucosamine-6-phosphate deaminase
MNWETVDSYAALSDRAASLLFAAIREKPSIVLGLPTGRTPIGMYERVVSECSREYHCFRDVVTFNLDEYVGVPSSHPSSYWTFMNEHLFQHVDVRPENTHIPNGVHPDPEGYEREIAAAGGLELTFLGLGSNGHIAFNEPGTAFDARTRIVELTDSTRAANAPLFAGGEVPTQAITMGIGTILSSRAIVLLASGAKKRDAVERLRSGVITTDFPASALHHHPNVRVIVDIM